MFCSVMTDNRPIYLKDWFIAFCICIFHWNFTLINDVCVKFIQRSHGAVILKIVITSIKTTPAHDDLGPWLSRPNNCQVVYRLWKPIPVHRWAFRIESPFKKLSYHDKADQFEKMPSIGPRLMGRDCQGPKSSKQTPW